MKITRILEILRLKRTPARIEAETKALAKGQAEIEIKEMELVEGAFEYLKSIKEIARYDDRVCQKKGMIAIDPRRFDEFVSLLGRLNSSLLDLEGRSENIIAVKERILSNLRKNSEGKEKILQVYIIRTEKRLIGYTESIKKHIEDAIQQVTLLRNQDLHSLEDAGNLEPKDSALAFHARAILEGIGKSLSDINDSLSKLFRMDEELRRK